MKEYQKQSLVWFVIYVVVLGAVILGTSSCSSIKRGYGCPDTWNKVGYR